MKQLIVALMGVALCLIASCVPKTELSVSRTSLTFDNKGGSQAVPVTANKIWSATPDQSWCKVTPFSGDGSSNSNVTLSVSCDPNTTYDSRSCTITVICEELTATIAVTQAEGTGLIVSQTDYSLNNEAQTVSVEVKSNVDYLVSVEGDATSWISVQSTKGLASNTIVLAVSENKDYDSRTGKVTVRDVGGSLSQTITIKQGEAYGLFVTKPEYDLSNEAHSLTVEVNANVPFDVIPQAEWIRYVETKGLKTSQIVLEVDANDTYDARESQVIVRQTGASLSETITIRQKETFGLIISKTGYGLSCEEQTIEVEVKYNVDLEVVIPDDCRDWIVPVETKGLTSRIFTFLVKKNDGYDARDGSITFKQKDGTLGDTVYIKQEAAPAIIVPTNDYSVSDDAQELEIEVQQNVELEVTVGEDGKDWIRFVETKGLSTGKYVFSIEKNETTEERTGTIIFSQKDGTLVNTISVRQKGVPPYIKVDPAEFTVSSDGQKIEVHVETNVEYDVEIDPETKGFISVKEISSDRKTVTMQVADNRGGKREGTVVFRSSEISAEVKVTQEGNFIDFKDKKVKALCVSWWDTDLDGEISYVEAENVSDLEDRFFLNDEITSFDELRYFTGLTEIAEYAFQHCSKLSSIIIPDQVTRIEEFAFSQCVSLTGITIPDNVKRIGESAFQGCTGLKTVVIPEGVVGLGPKAFLLCEGLQSVVLPSTLSEVREEAFSNCGQLKEVVIPEGVQEIYMAAFYKCKQLESIAIPSTVTVIYDSVFAECSNLSAVVLHDGITEIRDNAFASCSSLAGFTMPKNLTSIGINAFQGCSALTSVVIPEIVSVIGTSAFSQCDALTSVVLPESLSYLGEFAFTECPKLVSINIPGSLKRIEGYTFQYCPKLKDITIGEGVAAIAEYAFDRCFGLAGVVLPQSLTTIGECAFQLCESLPSVTIPKNVASIGDRAFLGCDNLSYAEVQAVVPPAGGKEMFPSSPKFPIYVPKGSVDNYKAAAAWSDYADRIQVK